MAANKKTILTFNCSEWALKYTLKFYTKQSTDSFVSWTTHLPVFPKISAGIDEVAFSIAGLSGLESRCFSRSSKDIGWDFFEEPMRNKIGCFNIFISLKA